MPAERMYSTTLESLERDYGDAMPKWATRPFGEKIGGDDIKEYLTLLGGAMALKSDQRWLWLEQSRETIEIGLKYKRLIEKYKKLSRLVLELQESLARRE